MQNMFPESLSGQAWWRSAVIYQIYPRSFADSNGDGIGDLKGITSKLSSLADLGIDAIWCSPLTKSPQKDAGYDVSDYRDIDPLFGNLEDFDDLVRAAAEHGIRIIMDLVPNHSSDMHPWFQEALSSAPDSSARNHYLFRDGKGASGEIPPNNWESVFGGNAWTRVTEANGELGQWYLHIFDSSQPDFNWDNPEVRREFEDVLRFWLNRGVAGFRIDVAHGLVKAQGLPDIEKNDSAMAAQSHKDNQSDHPFWGQDGVHEIIREWRKLLDEYDDRAMCAEAWVLPLSKMAKWVRPDEYHQTFNFAYLETPWKKQELLSVVNESIKEFFKVGAPATWVLSNHDVIRHPSRLSYDTAKKQGDGIGPSDEQPDEAQGLKRGRAATAFMLGLPGGAYVYQGEELGLPEATMLESKYRQDPTFFRTKGERVGRDGCRVPLPWNADQPAFGFSSTGASWIPQPSQFKTYSRDAQLGDPASTLEMYKGLLRVRKEYALGHGELTWHPELVPETALCYKNGEVLVVANFDGAEFELPAGELLATSQAGIAAGGLLDSDQVAWVKP
jgi:alpha-glucosidase